MRSLMKLASPNFGLDPSSRWGYRLQRIWLTPLFRALLRTGVPCLVVGLGTYAYISQPHVQQQIALAVVDAKTSIQERPEFMVHLMAIEGASDEVSEAIRAHIHVDLPASSFDLNLEALREAAEAMAPVKDATARVRAGGVLELAVIERVPALVWRHAGGLSLLDIDGVTVGQVAARGERADLPLVAGQGADAAVEEAIALLRAGAPITSRIRGLRRMGERRWDVVLDRGQVIQLPETDALRALERVILLDQAQDLLARDITHVDLRNPRRPTLRLAQSSLEELREIRGLELGVKVNE
ncbi:MAG: cell division protein FtsQ/DivIB [Pseudomonadota bacterium]